MSQKKSKKNAYEIFLAVKEVYCGICASRELLFNQPLDF